MLVALVFTQLLFIVLKVTGATRHNRWYPWNGETVSWNITDWKWNQKWNFKFVEHSSIVFTWIPWKVFSIPAFQMKKPSEKLTNLPRDTRLVSDAVGIRPDLFQPKSYAIHMGCKSLVIISIVTKAKCWFVHI